MNRILCLSFALYDLSDMDLVHKTQLLGAFIRIRNERTVQDGAVGTLYSREISRTRNDFPSQETPNFLALFFALGILGRNRTWEQCCNFVPSEQDEQTAQKVRIAAGPVGLRGSTKAILHGCRSHEELANVLLLGCRESLGLLATQQATDLRCPLRKFSCIRLVDCFESIPNGNVVKRLEGLFKILIGSDFAQSRLESSLGLKNIVKGSVARVLIRENFKKLSILKRRLLRFLELQGHGLEESFFNVTLFLRLNHLEPFEDTALLVRMQSRKVRVHG